MSLKNSLDKLKNAIDSTKSLAAARFMPGQLADVSWNPNCCVAFEGLNTTDPKVYLYCNGKLVKEIKLSEVAKNAKACPEVS